MLYVKGRVELLSKPSIAIVGSRNATAQGCIDAEKFGCSLSDAGLTIISGLALGIDAAAHRGGLKGSGSVSYTHLVAEFDAVFQPLELILPERIGRCYLIDFGNLFAG